MAAPKQFGFIHITSHGLVSAESLCSWVIVKAGHIIVKGQGDLLQATSACAKVPTALALSVQDLIVTKVTLPTQSQSQRRTAIPYAVQNQLAVPAQEVHWSWRAKGQQLQLVGITQTHLASINTTLDALSFTPKWLLADALHMSGNASHWQLMVLASGVLVQTGAHSAFCIDQEQPSPWLQKAYDEAHNSASGGPLAMHITGQANTALEQWYSSASVDIKTHENVQPFNSAGILSHSFDTQTCINLWPQKPRQMWTPNINWQLWRLPYALVVITALLGLSHLWLSNMTTAQNIDAVDSQSRAIFQSTLPNTRLVDAISQLEGQLLRIQEPKKTALFLPMLHAFQEFIGPLLATSEGSKVMSIEFLDEQLLITLVGSPESVDPWPKAGILAAKFGYKTERLEDINGAIMITIMVTVSAMEAY